MQSARSIIYQTMKQCREFSRFRAACQTTQPHAASQGEAMAVPPPEDQLKPASPKIEQLVSTIAALNLLEVAELSEVLKKRLNLPDAPVMAMGAVGAASPAAREEEEEEAAPQKVQTSFTLKLLKFDDKQKVALIKQVKSVLDGMNLVQAKKFVESAPTVVRADIAKDEAEKLKDALTSVGAVCEIV